MGGAAAVRGHGEHALAVGLAVLQEGFPARMAAHGGVLVVIESGAAHQAVFHGKAQRLDQVQAAARVGGQADHIAGVGRNLRRDENDMEHGAYCLAPAPAASVRGYAPAPWR
jgi:hypothetical protein